MSSLLPAIKKQLQSWGILEYFVVLMVICATVLRVWNLPNTLMFQGDQGRDAIIVADIFRHLDPVFIGPVTSVGNMYLGPLYYYFMLPFLLVSYPSPLGPAYAVAFLGVLTTFLVYFLGKEMVGKLSAALGSFFFAFANVAIFYSRFSWNPNIAPLFGLTMLWATYKAWTKNSWYWVIVSISFSILLQLHYLTLLALPAAGLIWFTQAVQLLKKEKALAKKKRFVLSTLTALVVFVAFLIPLALFDLKHQGLNYRAFLDLITSQENIGGELSGVTKYVSIIKETHGRSMHILFDLFIGQDRVRNTVLVIMTLLATGGLIKTATGKRQKGYIVLATYLGITIIGTAFYQHTLFDHYVGYIFSFTCLLYGSVIAFLLKHRVGQLLSLIFAGYFLWFNIPQYPLKTSGWTIYDMQRTAAVISEHVTPGKPYNIILLAESNDLYGQNYRYFLTTTQQPPVKPENFAQAEMLFIINENQPGVDVTQLPIYEIQTFPNKTVSAVYTVENGPDILVMEK